MLSCIIIGFYWRYLSKNWLWLAIYACSLNAISLIGLFIIPESPEYLYSFYRFTECREVIFKIARWNSGKIQRDSMRTSMALKEPNILPIDYKFTTEAELR